MKCICTVHLLSLGLLLYFDSGILAEYYFIDPQWFCDVLAVIVSPLPQINEFGIYIYIYSLICAYNISS